MKKIIAAVLVCLSGALFAAEPEWKYTLGEKEIKVTAEVPSKEYLYLKNTSVKLETDGKTVLPASVPASVSYNDEFSGKTEIYPGGKELVWIFRAEKWHFPLKLKIQWQGCSKGTADQPGVCFLPGSREIILKQFKAVPSPVPVIPKPGESKIKIPSNLTESVPAFEILRSESGYITAPQFIRFMKGEKHFFSLGFAGKSFWVILLLTFLGGMALNLTPCVLPMIPINLTIIGANNGSRGHCLVRGLVYGTGIALAYGILGIAVVLTGSSFGVIDSVWWFNALVAVVFIALGLTQFDLFSLDFSRFRSRLPVLSGARYAGIFMMGALAALLAGACVAPVVVAALVQAGKMYNSGEPAGLFLPLVLGIGMAFPWPMLAGGFAVMPKPGAWMKYVKYTFGVIIIGLGLYYGCIAYEIGTAKADVSGKSVRQLSDALRKSAAEKKPILVDFRAEWCKNCKAMEQTTFKDPSVIDELKNFIFVKFDATDISDPEISSILKKFNVSGLPAYLIVQGK